ncbi:MBL fold metallo-hydrolase [Mycolicibacterium sp. 3033]|nr:MBL fold metallo-hydrolase [Mycolicibacterium aurantiacum]
MTRWQTRALTGGAVLGVMTVVAGVVGYVNQGWLLERAIRHRLADGESSSFVSDPGQFKVLLCGTGSPEPSAAKSQACTLVAVAGKIFVFDVGEGASKSLSDSGVALDEIDRVFLTHLHSDHFNGLGGLINQAWIWGRSKPLDVTGPAGTAEVVGALNDAYAIDNGFRAANMPELDSRRQAAQAHPVDIVVPPGPARSVRIYDADGVTIDAHLVVHDPVEPAFGYVIQSRGKKVFISGDTQVSPLNLPAMRDADLVVHEAYASHLVRRAIPILRDMGRGRDAEVAERTIAYHADTIELAKQAEQARVEHLVLTHLTPYPASAIMRRVFTKGMGEYYTGTLTVGTDGLVLTV